MDHVWYACYGSNLNKNRFMCYIKGGTPPGALHGHPGCRDDTDPIKDHGIFIPREIYFAGGRTDNWKGGVCFLDADCTIKRGSETETKTKKESGKVRVDEKMSDEFRYYGMGRMYLITFKQFIDVVLQENSLDIRHGIDPTINDEMEKKVISFIEDQQRKKQIDGLEIMKNRYYGNLLYLGDHDSYPILSFTCKETVEKEILHPPGEEYLRKIVHGLFETHYPRLSKDEICEYILNMSGMKNKYVKNDILCIMNEVTE